MKKVDLHVHSTCSDGTLTPTELVAMAKDKGLAAMALTDHDTIAGVSEAMNAGTQYNIEIIPGIELSSCYHNKEIHIVGLFLDYKDDYLNTRLEELRVIRLQRNIKMAERFKECGIDISFDEMNELYKDAVITRAHFADYLLMKGYIKSRKEAFDRYIGQNGPCFIPRHKLEAKETIELIKAAKGVPILAHPTLYHLGNDELNRLISYLAQLGLVGLEGIYSTYTLGEELAMKRLAKENHLIISGGSDYHGANKPYLSLGTGKGHLCVPYEVLENIKKYAL